MYIKPFSDNLMTYNQETHRYTLTKDYVIKLSPDIITMLKNEDEILGVLEQISDDIYDYIHEYNTREDVQDYIIAHTDTGRRIIQKAMEKQLLYVSAVGDTTFYLDKDKREMYLAVKAKKILQNTIPEIGTCILYTGNLPLMLPEGW